MKKDRSNECDTIHPQGPPPDNPDDNYSFNIEGSQATDISFIKCQGGNK